MWAIITAFVLGERASSSMETSMLYWGNVTSTKTGTAPYCKIGATVVGNPAATVMTSSPLQMRFSPNKGEVKVWNASKLAEEPELTSAQCFTPMYAAKFRSNAMANRPAVKPKSSIASVKFSISLSS